MLPVPWNFLLLCSLCGHVMAKMYSGSIGSVNLLLFCDGAALPFVGSQCCVSGFMGGCVMGFACALIDLSEDVQVSAAVFVFAVLTPTLLLPPLNPNLHTNTHSECPIPVPQICQHSSTNGASTKPTLDTSLLFCRMNTSGAVWWPSVHLAGLFIMRSSCST